jgi:hypothetical protein
MSVVIIRLKVSVTQAHADVERSDKLVHPLHDLRLRLELMNFHLVFSFVRRKKKKKASFAWVNLLVQSSETTGCLWLSFLLFYF